MTVTKAWDDNNDQDGIRQSSIDVQLFQQTPSGGKTAVGDTVTLTNESDWTYTWTKLPLFSHGEEISYTVEELSKIPDYDTTINDDNHGNIIITNHHQPEKMELNGAKIWNDNDDQDGIRPNTLEIILYGDGEEIARTQATAQNNWSYTFTNLPVYSQGEKIDYSVSEVTVPGYESSSNGMNLTNTHIPEITSISGKKIWNDQENQDGVRPNTITVNLLANGVVIDSQEIGDADNWTYEFTNLPKYMKGDKIIYTVSENAVPLYTSSIEGTNIINNHSIEKTKISGNKIWDDSQNQDGKRPKSIIVYLLANGEIVKQQSVTPNESGDWLYEFDNLDKNEYGKEIIYTVEEELVPYYDSEVEGTIITNHYLTEVTDVKGSKTWDDHKDQDGVRPTTITVYLIANGDLDNPVATKVVSEATNWTYEFNGLPVYQEGKKVTYSVVEEPVKEYTTTVNGFDIINSYNPSETSVAVKKVWDDQKNQDGIRPLKITVQLYANGKETGKTEVLNEKNNWSFKWDNLPEKENSQEIAYSVKEIDVPKGYDVTEFKNEEGDVFITNHHYVEKISISGMKIWKDNDDALGKRPKSITINLLADDEIVASQMISMETMDNEWAYTFTDMPKYKDGKEVIYTVAEKQVDDYVTSIEGYTITNTYREQENLPKTGEQQSRWFLTSGIIITSAISFMFLSKKMRLKK